MGLYYIPPSLPYLESIADYVIEKHFVDFSKVKIYLPTYKACRYLQEIFLKKVAANAIILPTISTLYEIDFLNTWNISSSAFYNEASSLEQELVLTEIIMSYPRFNYSVLQALNLSKSLASLFKELILHEVDLERLNELYNADYAEHWLNIQEFLLFARQEWDAYLVSNNKVDNATQQILGLEDKINFLKDNSSNEIIIADFQPEYPQLLRLLKVATERANIIAILPPLSNSLVINFWDSVEHQPKLQYLKNLLNYCNLKPSDIKSLIPQMDHIIDAREKCLFNLFFLNKPSIKLPIEGIQGINYLSTANQVEEGALIAVIIKYLMTYEPVSKIAIITRNQKIITQAETFLNRFDLKFARIGKENLNTYKAAGFLKLLYKMIEFNFQAAKTLAFMKHPYFYCDEVFAFEMKILRAPEMLGGHEAIIDKLKHQSDDALILWFSELLIKLEPLIQLCQSSKNHFKDILVMLIKVAEDICKELWEADNIALVEYLQDLIEEGKLLPIIDTKDFESIFNILLSRVNIESSTIWDPKVFVASPDEVHLIPKVDYLILADLNDDSWPSVPLGDPWMGDRMRESLGLEKKSYQIIKDLQSFYNALHVKNIFLTRSIKSEGAETAASRFLLKLLSKLETQNLLKHLNPEIDWLAIVKDILIPNKMSTKEIGLPQADLCYFPKQIAATYIELLMRNPYAFYAKKILKLKKLELIAAEAGAREFGIFLHNVLEEYTVGYHRDDEDKYIIMLDLGRQTLLKHGINRFTESLWWPKFKNIARDFIEFDENRRKLFPNIHTEEQGYMKLNIGEQEIILTAKADRIETDNKGNVNIIDFKTGYVPPLKDVVFGLSPQLLIEQLILENDGFELFKNAQEINISYIKLGASKPHLKESVLKLKVDVNSFTHEGIKKLLEFFLRDGACFLSCPNKSYAPHYNDYDHLARDK